MTQSKKIAIKGSKAHTVKGSRKVGAPDPGEKIEVVVHLRYHPESKSLPSMEELAAYPPHKRKHMTHEEFEKHHGASPVDIEKVKKFAREHNLVVKEVDLAHRLVTLTGTIKAFSSAFEVQFFNYQHPDYSFRSHEGEINIPVELTDLVDGIFGLDNIPAARPYISHHQQEDSAENSLEGKFYPDQVAQLYSFPKHLTGKGQSIAIIELGGGYGPGYFREYFKKLDIKMPKITDVLVAEGENKPYKGPIDKNSISKYIATVEVYGDIEVAGAAANEAELVVYFGPNTYKGFLQTLKQAVHDKKHNNSVISISWGFSEKTWKERMLITTAINQTLHEAAAKGITVCVASGDNGSSDSFQDTDGLAYVDFPASSPFSLGCGGTRLFVRDNKIQNETVWKHHCDVLKLGAVEIKNVTNSTGGGVSEIFKCPGYQFKASVCTKSVNPGNKTGRGVPDIAGNADRRSGYIIQVNDTIIPFGGTSLVAPLYAALIALINQKLDARVGFLNPFLYRNGGSKDVFNDITEGDNITAKVGGYRAGKGWDACTGWGSINGENLLEAIQESDV